MKKKTGISFAAVLLTMLIMASMLTGCGTKDEKEDADSISIYLWSASLYNEYAPYIQSKLPDVDIEFVVGNNDLDYYKFLKKNGQLPDIITARRFSLNDAAELQDQLMDLSYTEEASAMYHTYLSNYTNPDGTVNWLPLCGEVDGFIANKALFDKYDIPLPTDYASFVSACEAFEKVGIRGCASDFEYDYTCMEILQGLSIPELHSMDGQVWRSQYEDSSEATGLDTKIWPGIFERMEQFIEDTDVSEEDLKLSYDPVEEMFLQGKIAMTRRTGAGAVSYKEGGVVDPVMLPYFGEDGEEWLLTYPSFHVALNKDLEKDDKRKEQALQILNVMLSEEGQNVLAKGEDVISYSKDVELELSPVLSNLKSCIDKNHLYIRLASNEFFSVSQDVVSKMITGECDAKQAYEAFDSQLKNPQDNTSDAVMTLNKSYSNEFYKDGGNASSSVMANTLREFYGSDVLIAPAYSFTGTVIQADYTEDMVGYMIMPNSLEAWQCDMTGAELKEYLETAVEGAEGLFTPFNRGSLPTVSGMSIEVEENNGQYILNNVLLDGKELSDTDTVRATCLETPDHIVPALEKGKHEETRVKDAWIEYIKNGGSLAGPENYITLK
ncbi:MAG: extracellular solute-binding protein [Bacillota bacterium]|nr:extracellular solute-binding protein [Bacillota bacterium]